MNIEIKHNTAPLSTQHIYGHRSMGRGRVIRYMTKKAKDWKQEFIKSVKEQLPKDFKPTKNKVGIWLIFTFGTKHKHDLDNFSKLIFDGMNELVYEDDNQIESLRIYKKYKKGEPSIELDIWFEED